MTPPVDRLSRCSHDLDNRVAQRVDGVGDVTGNPAEMAGTLFGVGRFLRHLADPLGHLIGGGRRIGHITIDFRSGCGLLLNRRRYGRRRLIEGAHGQ